ncbi:MAG: protein kinase domain-containing protein [Nocardioides sp.]|uniref:protein kinase domain-containing protein n=1 Tax=Nocardioides sp. TaxID=35761 RepID=UPI003D6A3EBE
MASPNHEPPEIPGFRHRRLIGTGGSSDVYLYEWEQEKVNVVIKVWHERLSATTHDALAKETKEVAELAGHPYVLPLHAVGVTGDDRSFVVMDYRAGGDLETRSQRVSVEEALSITIKVASALDVAARHRILHGDVKPVNIMLTSSGVPQLVGFGSLSSAGRPGGAASTSLPWMAPEMLTDPPEPSAWADIWSLAATCYTLLAGRTPFEGTSGSDAPEIVLERIREFDPLTIDRDDVPASLEKALRTAMYKRRAGRHWSAAVFAKALQAIEEELGLPVTPLADVPEPVSGSEDNASDAGTEAGADAGTEAGSDLGGDADTVDATDPAATVETEAAEKADGPPQARTQPRSETPAATMNEPNAGSWVAKTMGSQDAAPVVVPSGPGIATYAMPFGPGPTPDQEPSAAPAAAPKTDPKTEPRAAAPEPVQPGVRPMPEGDTAEVPIVVDPMPEPDQTDQTDQDDDLLGHRGDADRLARLLLSAHTQLPISVAVQGLPGSGRSTFLRKVQERIEWITEHDGASPHRTRHVRINARQHAEGDVASGVLERVRSAGRSEPPPIVASHQAAQRRRTELRAALSGMPEEDGHRGKRRTQPMSTTMALEAMDREVAAYEAALRTAPPGPPPGSPAASQTTRTIVYVDDLDRCDPATAAGVLQAIDDLGDQEDVAVVAAVDARALQRSIEGRVTEPAAYLSRVFDVPFALRAFVGDPAVRFMRSLMRQAVPSWPSALAAGGSGDRSARQGAVESVEMSPGEALFTSELARFCATPRGARKLLTVYRLARSAPVASARAEPTSRHALGVLMAILVGAPAQAAQVLGAVVEALAAGEDGATFQKLLEKVAREHTVECGRATCSSCADWSRVIRAHADLVRAQPVPQEVGAYADWVDEVARFSLPT